jgi:hypothetical protein
LLAWSVSIIEATNGGEGLNFVYVINYIDEIKYHEFILLMQHHHNGTFIIKSSQKPMQNREVNPPGSKTSRSTRPMGRLWSIFF